MTRTNSWRWGGCANRGSGASPAGWGMIDTNTGANPELCVYDFCPEAETCWPHQQRTGEVMKPFRCMFGTHGIATQTQRAPSGPKTFLKTLCFVHAHWAEPVCSLAVSAVLLRVCGSVRRCHAVSSHWCNHQCGVIQFSTFTTVSRCRRVNVELFDLDLIRRCILRKRRVHSGSDSTWQILPGVQPGCSSTLSPGSLGSSLFLCLQRVGADLHSFHPALRLHAVLSQSQPEGNVRIVPCYFSVHATCLLGC